MTARRVTTILLVVAQTSTAAYVVVYLYRWQWNRALIAGVLFIATEILLIGRLVLQRLADIERKLATPAPIHDALVATRDDPVSRFAWLQDAASRTNVFLPVLLGAGVLASAVAWVVEGIARRTARPALERSLAATMTPFAFPADGFLGVGTRLPMVPVRHVGRVPLVLAAIGVVLGVGVAVDVVADATQTRPEQLEEGVTTVIDLQLRGDRPSTRPEAHAADLFAACRSSVGRDTPSAVVVGSADRRVRVILEADLGKHGAQRLSGCLEDTTLDRVQADVAEITRVPPPPN